MTRALRGRARQYPGQERQVWEYYQKNPQMLAGLRAPIFEEKVVDYLLALASVNDREVSRDELFQADDAGEEAAQPGA